MLCIVLYVYVPFALTCCDCQTCVVDNTDNTMTQENKMQLNLLPQPQGVYESKSWVAEYSDQHEWEISIMYCPTLSADFNKWKILMKRSETERSIMLCLINNVRLDYKYFNKIYIPVLCNMLKNNLVIETLALDDVLNSAGMKCVCQVLQTNKTITSVQFLSYKSPGNVSSALEHLLLHNKCIKTLEVFDADNDAAEGIAKALPHNSILTELHLANSRTSRIDKTGMRLLSKALLQNHTITIIDFSDQKICDEGAKALCSVLEVNHTITDINLGGNEIMYLPKSYAFLTHIKKLYLRGNWNMRFPPAHVQLDDNDISPKLGMKGRLITHQERLSKFFANFRYFPVRFHFLLGFHVRVGKHSSIQAYLYRSSIFEPALLGLIFKVL